jgi:hypothetical protein
MAAEGLLPRHGSGWARGLKKRKIRKSDGPLRHRFSASVEKLHRFLLAGGPRTAVKMRLLSVPGPLQASCDDSVHENQGKQPSRGPWEETMATDRSGNEHNVADKRSVRAFLEHAAPIILESRVLEGERFRKVCALADRFGLTRDQLACELRLLEQRGVISSAPWHRLDAQWAANASDTKSDQLKHDSPSRAEKRRPAGKAASPQPSPSAPPERKAQSPPEQVNVSPTASALEALRQRAMKQLGRHGVITPKTRRKLEKAGKQAGLTSAQIAAVLESLPEPEGGPDSPGRGDAAGAPPAPEAGGLSPSESFRRWAGQKLSDYPSSILATEDEDGLVGVGVHRYRLAQVLATHIVRDVATDQDVRLERDLDNASCNSTVGTSEQVSADDDKLKEFFEQVAPILSQHRGINAKSRVLIAAIADQLGMSESELEKALEYLQRSARDPDEDDPRQLERRESFRAYLRRALAQLPKGIITFQTYERLCQAGEHFHGVAPKWIKPTINEVAAEMGARFISKEQAVEHVTQLVEDQLNDRPVIPAATRARIYSEGTRWGLDPVDIDAILRERTETLRQQLAAERRRTRWVINFIIGGLCIAGTTLCVLFLLRPIPTSSTNGSVASPSPREKEPAKTANPVPWWGDDLRIALARLRVRRPDLRERLDQLMSPQGDERAEAYRHLVEQFQKKMPRRDQREAMRPVLASLYAQEPSDRAAQALAQSLLADLVSLEDELPEKREALEGLFWACRAAVSMLKHPTIAPERRDRLRERLEQVTFINGDLLLEADALERLYAGALARRLYQLLAAAAPENPAHTGRLYQALHAWAPEYLDPPALERLELNYLAAVLPALGENWQRYVQLISNAAQSSDPNTVIKLLDIYRQADDQALRGYIASLFLERLGAASGTLTEKQMIDQLRESLGIASREREIRRWNQLAQTADELLAREPDEQSDPEKLLQETVELAHAATLACALSRGEIGGRVFDQLQEDGPVELALPGGRRSASLAAKTSYPVSSQTVLKQHIGNLSSAATAGQRISLLRMIANRTENVPNIDAPSGQILAEYLTRFKVDEQEHRQMLTLLPRIGRWPAVRLGLADQLIESPGRDTQLREVYQQLLEEEVDLSTQEDRDRVRRRLLAQVAAALSDAPAEPTPRLQTFDRGSTALLELFRRQAELRGVAKEQYARAEKPSAVVLALVEHLAASLSSSKLEATDRRLLEELPHRLKAIDFAAQTDIQYTAALQQIWLELLAIEIAQQRPAKSSRIHEIRSHNTSLPDESVFQQLWQVQTDLLRLWLQRRPAFGETMPKKEMPSL